MSVAKESTHLVLRNLKTDQTRLLEKIERQTQTDGQTKTYLSYLLANVLTHLDRQ